MRAVALVTSLALAGCSFFMTERPKPPPADPSCTSTYGAVALDVVGALTWPFVLGIAYIGASAEGGNLDDDDAATAGVIITGTFIAELVSAGVGISRVSSCRDAYRARAAYPYYQQQQPYYPPQPQPYYPPQPQPQPQPQPPGGLGQEGDSCNIPSDCATGLTCQANRCAR